MLGLMAVLFILFLSISASAAEYKRLGSLASVADGPHQELSTVKATFSAGELRAGDVVLISLPKDFSFNCDNWSHGSSNSGDVYYGNYDHGCYIYVPWDDDNGLNMAVNEEGQPVPTNIFTVTGLRDNEFSIRVNPVLPALTEDGYFFIYLKDVDVPGGHKGAITLSFDAPGGSGFGVGEVTGGRVGRLDPVEDETKPDEIAEEKKSDISVDEKELDEKDQEQDRSQELRVIFSLGSSVYTINGDEQAMDVAPYVKEGRAYLPMRFAAKALGIKDSAIAWEKGTARFTLDDIVVSVTIGNPTMYIDGSAVTMDAVPEIAASRTMLPIRWIGEAFGVDVSWNAVTQQIIIE